MAENLNFDAGEGSYCYNELEENCEIYGRLYAWDTLMNGDAPSNSNPSGVQALCPSGWHLPSDKEWEELDNFIGGDADKLKAIDSWDRLENKTDDWGFSAKPGGLRLSNGLFRNWTAFAYWWGATEDPQVSNNGRYWSLGAENNYLYNNFNTKYNSYSVRCVKD